MKQKHTLIAVILSGIGASLCCIVPLILVTLGISGAWISHLSAMEPYRPIFIGLTIIFLGIAFRKLYLAPHSCKIGALCADDKVIKRQRFVFWLVVIPVLGLIAFPWMAPLFY
jgi:mercuric ion transport protein